MARPPRIRPPTERPLDDGPRDGTEVWRVIDGVAFCHWDRWLLRLATTETGGLDAIAAQFRARSRRRYPLGGDDDEAMLAQVLDLRARLSRVGATPATVLDETERASEWLRRKAFTRVWHGSPRHRTEAMHRTPRRVLAQRALHGHWPRLPVSPGAFHAALRRVSVTTGYAEYWATPMVAHAIEFELERLAHATTTDLERLALYRAAVTVFIEAMDHVDDSGADMSMAFEAVEREYLRLVRDHATDDRILRDFLELVVWEDYGLFQGVEAFLGALPEPLADAVLRELAPVIAELRRAALDHPLAKARSLRRAVLVAAQRFSDDDEAEADDGE